MIKCEDCKFFSNDKRYACNITLPPKYVVVQEFFHKHRVYPNSSCDLGQPKSKKTVDSVYHINTDYVL